MKVMVVEDEPGLQLGLRDIFEDAGHQTRVRGRGGDALADLPSFAPDLVILDLGLPDMDGTQVLARIHQDRPQLPVLVLTARDGDADIVKGFQLGAFDYVTKPFSPAVLKARAEALVRRHGAGDVVHLGDLCLDFERYEAKRGETLIKLTTREFSLLKFLAQHEGKPVTRHDILDEVWGMESDAGTRTVDTHVAMLRKKIEPNPERPAYLLSQRGVGYKLITS